MEIPGCMKQHLMLFTQIGALPVENLCDCLSCLQFKFDECFKEKDAGDVYFLEDLEGFEDDECDKDTDLNQTFFEFVDVPSFVSLFPDNTGEPLYFVRVAEKGTAIKDVKDLYGHVICTSELFFKRNCLKFTRS